MANIDDYTTMIGTPRTKAMMALDRLKSINYTKYLRYVYTFVVFVSSLLLLVICVAIIIVGALTYKKIKSIIITVETVQAKVDKLINSSFTSIIATILGTVIELIKGLTGGIALSHEDESRLASMLLDNSDQLDPQQLLTNLLRNKQQFVTNLTNGNTINAQTTFVALQQM